MLESALIIIVLNSALYMAVALGFTLVFGVLRIVNFAHGEFLMLGAYGIYVLQVIAGLSYWLALPLAALFSGVVGVVVERTLFRRFVGNELGGMIVSLGLAIALQGAVRAIFGADSLAVDRPVTGVVTLGGATLPLDQLTVAALALVLIVAVFVLLNHSRLGLAMRAVAQDAPIARLQGIVPWRAYTLAFALSCMLAGFAGALISPLYGLQTYMGDQALLRAFIVVVLGGLGSIPGAVLASFILATIDTAVSMTVGSTAATLVSFLVVIAVLSLKPGGLMGKA